MEAERTPISTVSLPPMPTRRAARQDWYRTIGLTLAWISLLGVGAALSASLLLLPEWVSRVGLTLAGLSLAVHVGLSIMFSRTPRLEA
jgi:hypothetical protein